MRLRYYVQRQARLWGKLSDAKLGANSKNRILTKNFDKNLTNNFLAQ
jgi:hypothetical protein